MASTLVWGGTGFIGRHLVSALLDANRPVVVVTRRFDLPLSYISDPNLTTVFIEPGKEGSCVLRDLISAADVIFNLAGVSGAVASNRNVLKSLDGNCRIQAEFLDACADAGNRPHIVFASSRLVYGTPDKLPVDEKASLRPVSAYAAHKLCVEHYHQIYAARNRITYTICRISNPYGKVDWQGQRDYGFISNLIRCGVSGETLTLFGSGTQLRDYVHISDLTAAMVLAGTQPAARNEIFNIGSGAGASLRDAAEAIRNLTGAPISYAAWPDDYVVVESGDYIADISKAANAIGFLPRYQFHDGLKNIAEQYHRDVRLAPPIDEIRANAVSA